jgi:thymidylate kinase
MDREESEVLLQRINQEGFDYCFIHYSRFEEINDKEFHKLRKGYIKAKQKLENYIVNQKEKGTEDEMS